MDDSQIKEDVQKALNGEGAETPPAETPQAVPPVITVEPKAPVNVDPSKLQEQISNLNTALSQERNEKKIDKEKIAALEQKIQESTGIMDRMKNVFSPEPEPEPMIPTGLTKDELIQILDEREQEKQQKTEEQKRSELIQNEIKQLETVYSGKDGGLKYDDQEVLQWQKDNNKLYLTPKEAFSVMREKEIIDYKVKEVLSGRKPVENVETPGGSPSQHEPTEVLPKTEQETRAAIIEAMENANREL
jgi:hypothetical protein